VFSETVVVFGLEWTSLKLYEIRNKYSELHCQECQELQCILVSYFEAIIRENHLNSYSIAFAGYAWDKVFTQSANLFSLQFKR